jgi:hypothetical protein
MHANRKLSGKHEALLAATACAKPPKGRKRWTLELLASEIVRLTDHAELSRETVRRRLEEDDLKLWLRDMWCIPHVDGTYVARLEDVLDLYAEAPDPQHRLRGLEENPAGVPWLSTTRRCSDDGYQFGDRSITVSRRSSPHWPWQLTWSRNGFSLCMTRLLTSLYRPLRGSSLEGIAGHGSEPGRRRLRIPTMPSGHTELEASTCSDLMPSTVLMRWRPGGVVSAGRFGSCHE